VFKDFPIEESLIAFFDFYAETATAGLTGGIVNFWGECPFGQPPLGLSVNLNDDGGMQIGGILIDYHEKQFPENLVFIKEDGYIYPPTPLIVSNDSRVYRLIDDISTTLIIKRDNIILDGCGYTLSGGVIVTKKEDNYGQKPVENVTITSMRIEGGVECSRLGYVIHVAEILVPNIEKIYKWSGIILDRAVNATILNNDIAGCQVGIAVWEGKNCTILGNNIKNAGAQPSLIIYTGDETGGHNVTSIGIGIGVMLNNAEQTLVSENTISSCEVGIFTKGGITSITSNHLIDNDFGVWADGMEAISHNYIFQCRHGISNDWTRSWMSYEKNIFGNTILNCYSGINVWVGRYSLQILHNRVINCTETGIRAGSWSAIYSSEDEEAARKRNISENEVLNCTCGIIITGRITASRNNVMKCTYGMAGYDQSIIEKNDVANCIYGISAPGQFITINKNNVIRCTYGITIGYHSHIKGNNVMGCTYGITADEKTGLAASVGGNNIRDCVYGINAGNADLRNTIYGNNLTRCTYGITGGEYIKENKIVKCTYGITIRSNWGTIERNDIGDCEYGITAPKEADELKVIENNLRDCTYGIFGGGIIEENNVMNCNYGITGLIRSAIHRNNVINCTCGIIITGPSNPYLGSLNGNNIIYCHKGILMEEKRGYMIRRNNLVKNDFGIYITAKLNINYTITENSSTISQNNFIMNNVSIFIEDDNLHHVTIYIFNNNFIENGKAYGEPYQCVWSWDLPTGGNYWSDYEGVDEKNGENQDQPGADGIGDKPYLISGKAVDKYPLMEPFGNLPSITIEYTLREWVITLTSNSAISNFKCNLENKVVSFYVQGKSGTKGFVSINIPKSIVSREVEVLFDGKPIPFNKSEIADDININFTYEHTKHYVEIRFGVGGGVPPQLSTQNYIIFVATAAGLLLIALLLALYLRKRRTIPSKAEPLPPPPPPYYIFLPIPFSEISEEEKDSLQAY
ncbi:MAG: NosD domain-containing protein, partial [Candidatus Bathyarchaeia archaeon]